MRFLPVFNIPVEISIQQTRTTGLPSGARMIAMDALIGL